LDLAINFNFGFGFTSFRKYITLTFEEGLSSQLKLPSLITLLPAASSMAGKILNFTFEETTKNGKKSGMDGS